MWLHVPRGLLGAPGVGAQVRPQLLLLQWPAVKGALAQEGTELGKEEMSDGDIV